MWENVPRTRREFFYGVNTHWVVNVQDGIAGGPREIPISNCEKQRWGKFHVLLVHVRCCGAKSPLTRHVLVHHVGAMFYKEAKHGGGTRSTLQPEEHWSLLTGLSIREEHMSTAPPSGNVT